MVLKKICNMSYAEIKDHVAAELHCEAKLVEVPRSNREPEVGLSIKKDEKISFIFHLEEAIKKTPAATIEQLTEDIRCMLKTEAIKLDLNNLRCERVVPHLVNTAANKEMLKALPHRNILDLSVIYEIPVQVAEGVIGTAKITNQAAEAQGFTEEQLYEIALQNMDPKLRPLSEVMAEAMEFEQGDLDPTEFIRDGFPKMYVLTNARKFHGAAAVLRQDMLRDLSEKLGSDLYIMPSSIHEVLIVPADKELEAHMLLAMVSDVNGSVVEKKEQLSNSLYSYSPDKGLTLAGIGYNL